MLHYARAAGSRFNPDQTENLGNASIRLMSGRSFLFLSISFQPPFEFFETRAFKPSDSLQESSLQLRNSFNKDFQGQSLSNFKLYDDERQGQRVHEMVCFNRTKCNRCKVTMVMMVIKMFEMMMVVVVVVVLRDKCISGLCFNWD